jgi:hypothetical protein
MSDQADIISLYEECKNSADYMPIDVPDYCHTLCQSKKGATEYSTNKHYMRSGWEKVETYAFRYKDNSIVIFYKLKDPREPDPEYRKWYKRLPLSGDNSLPNLWI